MSAGGTSRPNHPNRDVSGYSGSVEEWDDTPRGRPQIPLTCCNSADDYLKVHDQSPGHADVTEGSHGIWERLQYDWSDPNRVVMKTIDSNTWGGASGHTYTFTRQPNGTTDVDVVVVREGKNIKGRVLGILVGAVGKRSLDGALRKTVKAIEARNHGAPAA